MARAAEDELNLTRPAKNTSARFMSPAEVDKKFAEILRKVAQELEDSKSPEVKEAERKKKCQEQEAERKKKWLEEEAAKTPGQRHPDHWKNAAYSKEWHAADERYEMRYGPYNEETHFIHFPTRYDYEESLHGFAVQTLNLTL
ncbi:MAG TPA: hypothetical protein VFG51_00990 [Candidatus Saccharimonadia bacterium]|nr:hypothetical protein [Candidatus Saccharimonadia bacterium]